VKYLFNILTLLLCCSLAAQNDNESLSLILNEISLISLQPDDQSIVLNVNVREEAGELIIESNEDNSKYLNYTTSVSTGGGSKGIFVEINSGSLPPGLQLSVRASNYQGSGDGVFGQPVGEVLLEGAGSEKLISGIRGAYTGVGEGNGHQLTYKIVGAEPEEAGQWDGSTSLLITYTIAND